MKCIFSFVPLLIIGLAASAYAGEAPCPTRSQNARQLGRYSAFASNRIAGGEETSPNEFPWQAYILVYFWNGGSAVCGGSLISDEWVLSASHCFEGTINMTLILGAHDTTEESNDAHREVFYLTPRDVQKYPNWHYPDVEGDVALIKLSRRVSINNFIRPISLPYKDDPSFESEAVILTGWGNFSSVPDSGLSPRLRKTLTYVLGSQGVNPACQRESGLSFDGAKIICGDGKSNHRSCYGDDGGPMNYYRVDETDWVVVGIASLGDSTDGCASSQKPSLYNRVSFYLDWIHNNTNIPPRVRTTTTSTTTTTTTRTTTTRTTTSPRTAGPYDYVCYGNPNGDYPIPGEVCTKYFVSCSNGIGYLMECALQGTVFWVGICRCDYPSNVPECTNYAALPRAWLKIEKN